jgi:hypothetical protein
LDIREEKNVQEIKNTLNKVVGVFYAKWVVKIKPIYGNQVYYKVVEVFSPTICLWIKNRKINEVWYYSI